MTEAQLDIDKELETLSMSDILVMTVDELRTVDTFFGILHN